MVGCDGKSQLEKRVDKIEEGLIALYMLIDRRNYKRINKFIDILNELKGLKQGGNE